MGISKQDFSSIKWVLSEHGEFPSTYSDSACRIISDKYFKKGEQSWFDVVKRVADTIAQSGWDQKYFDDKGEMEVFARDLGWGMLNQEFSFNSPVYFNVGIEDKPQCSACFIQSVDDTMESILDLAKKEGMLFKHGSGTGTNLSPLRAKGSPLSKGGESSGPLEFMKMYDAAAGVIKSGGKNRRSAKMVILNHDHPDIGEFIRCKADEEQLVKDGMPLERAWFQNGNNTVRVTDQFMRNATSGGDDRSPDRDKLEAMAQAAWECGDPGIQFADTINEDMPNGLECNSSNPCGEYMFIDDSACNLASINLVKCPLLSEGFETTVHLLIKAMDIIVEMSSYPSQEIEANSHKYRPLGLGYTNLGTYLMNYGAPYGGEAALDRTAHITRRMRWFAEDASRQLAERFHPYPGGSLRNAQLTLLAPTGTISFAMDCQSTGIEPVFAEESHKKLEGGGTIVSVPECIRDAEDRGVLGAIKVALSTDKDRVVTPYEHLEMMAAAQPNLSGAISKTINMPNDCTVQDVFDVYVKAWELGLKGVAVFRDGCKSFQPMTTKPKAEEIVFKNGSTMKVLPGEGEPWIGNSKFMYTDLDAHEATVKDLMKGIWPTSKGIRERATGKSNWEIDNTAAEEAVFAKSPVYEALKPSERTAEKPNVDTWVLTKNGEVIKTASTETGIIYKNGIGLFEEIPAEKPIVSPQLIAKESWDPMFRLGFMSVMNDLSGDVWREVNGGPDLVTPKTDPELDKAVKVILDLTKDRKDVYEEAGGPKPNKLPETRPSITHKVSIAGISTYITFGLYPDGSVGEVFVSMSKAGSSVRGWADSWATLLSIAIQNGVPLERLTKKFRGTKFEPAGFTGREDVRHVDSVVDCVVKLLDLHGNAGSAPADAHSERGGSDKVIGGQVYCPECGTQMSQSGTCHTCPSCGETSGGCS